MNLDLFSRLDTSFVLQFPHGSMWKLWDFRTLVFYVIQLPVISALADQHFFHRYYLLNLADLHFLKKSLKININVRPLSTVKK